MNHEPQTAVWQAVATLERQKYTKGEIAAQLRAAADTINQKA
jgi:hypothetical protein